MSNSTPPNWPIYNITLSKDEIRELVKRVYPDAGLVSTQDLSRGKSFNNRIYFLHVKHHQETQGKQEIVLKVIGRFFDGRKIQNEVGSLLLLARFCPGVPVPEVLAWSDDGRRITTIRNGVYAVLSDPVVDQVPPTAKPHPWIMMSKRPGRILGEDIMNGEHAESIATQLADMVKSWRESIPSREEIGNIKLQSAGFTSSHALHGLDTIVSELLLTDTQPDSPTTTLQQYYDHLLADQVHKVNTNNVFADLRPLAAGDLHQFRLNTFSHLPCFQNLNLTKHEQQPGSIFTHQDLSPRNILISESETSSHPIITGLLDFEFSGFFPPEEEYLTCLGRQADDWPKPFMDILLSKLESKGVAIPKRQEKPNNFARLLQVIELIEYVAPWWLQDGHITGKELEMELGKARDVVTRNMAELTASVAET